jgi:hypothetical protein
MCVERNRGAMQYTAYRPLGPHQRAKHGPVRSNAGFQISHVSTDLHQVLMVISNALLAWGPVHDNHAPHNVDDDADPCSVRLSHIIADFETHRLHVDPARQRFVR